MHWKRKKKFYQTRRFTICTTVALLVTLTVLLIAPRAKLRFHRWSIERRVQRAADFYAKGDYKRALLDARSALDSSPLHAEAILVIARTLEAMDRPEAIGWRRHLDAIGQGNAENTMALALDTLKAGDPATARSVLTSLQASARNSAAYHDLAAKIALATRDEAGAEAHWTEAARLDPKDEEFQFSLAKMRVKSRDPGVRQLALDGLNNLCAKPGHRLVILRTMIEDALNHADASRAAELADRLVAAPESTFADKLTRLTTLRAMDNPESASLLLELKNEAASKPRDLYQLLRWMNRNDLALTVSDWAASLPLSVSGRPPVSLAIAEAYSLGSEWEKLEETVADTSWEQHEYLRTTYRTLALQKLGDNNAAANAWNASLAEAWKSPEAMENLARIALNWGWNDKAEAVLWSLSESARCPRWVLDALWRASLRRGESTALYDLSKLLANAAPKDVAHRHNVILLGLLTHGKDSAIHRMAESLYQENRGNADITATYGLSLYQRGRVNEALAVMDTLKPEQLREPGVARYYGIFLSATKHPGKAKAYLEIGARGTLLPEEKALMAAPKLASSAESGTYLRQSDMNATPAR